eukprot:SM000419S15580  [mRNA]  locus=s419:21256:24161:- [translate_table: standard]
MKFAQQLAAYRADSSPPKLPVLDFKLLKKILAKCPGNILDADVAVPDDDRDPGGQTRDTTTSRPTCSIGVRALPLHTLTSCGVFSACDASFFQELTQQIIIVLSSFNKRARKLLRLHQSKGLRRHYYMLKLKFIWSYASLCEAGKQLETYIQMNSTAVKKILKKYKKIHGDYCGAQSRASLGRWQHLLDQSPFLLEIKALQYNVSSSCTLPDHSKEGGNSGVESSLQAPPSQRTSTTPMVAVGALVDMTCPVCLELLFDPISLNCGHVFCNGCACLAAGVTAFQGALAAPAGSKCPLCRQSGVYCAVLRMTELHMMIKSRQPVDWEQRYDQERAAFLRQAREYWSRQAQGMLGYI